jgi:MinD-like ATPase involved in chromosome partitioning or flagellar assembly
MGINACLTFTVLWFGINDSIGTNCNHVIKFIDELEQSIDPLLAVNRFRTTALGKRARVELEETFLALAKLRVDVFIPEDRENLDKAMLNGLPLALLKRSSPARIAIAELAKQVSVGSISRRSVAKL